MRLLAGLAIGAAMLTAMTPAVRADDAPITLTAIVPVTCSVSDVAAMRLQSEVRVEFFQNCNTRFALQISVSGSSLPAGLSARYRGRDYPVASGQAVSGLQPWGREAADVIIADDNGLELPADLAVRIAILPQ